MRNCYNNYKNISKILICILYLIFLPEISIEAKSTEQTIDNVDTASKLSNGFEVTISLKQQLNTVIKPENHTPFEIIVGEKITLDVVVKNTSKVPLAYDRRYIRWPQNYSIFCSDTREIITSMTKVNMTVAPYSQDDIVILNYNEEKLHEVRLSRIFPWCIPEMGKWNTKWGQFGQVGNYTLYFENTVSPERGISNNKAGYKGNFFCGYDEWSNGIFGYRTAFI